MMIKETTFNSLFQDVLEEAKEYSGQHECNDYLVIVWRKDDKGYIFAGTPGAKEKGSRVLQNVYIPGQKERLR